MLLLSPFLWVDTPSVTPNKVWWCPLAWVLVAAAWWERDSAHGESERERGRASARARDR